MKRAEALPITKTKKKQLLKRVKYNGLLNFLNIPAYR